MTQLQSALVCYVPTPKPEITNRIWLARAIPVRIEFVGRFVDSLIMCYGIRVGINNSSIVCQHSPHFVVIRLIISKKVVAPCGRLLANCMYLHDRHCVNSVGLTFRNKHAVVDIIVKRFVGDPCGMLELGTVPLLMPMLGRKLN